MWSKLIARDQVAAAVAGLAQEMDARYAEGVVLAGLLQGGLFLLADLARAMRVPVEMGTMQPQSYRGATQSSGRVELRHDLTNDIEGRDLVVVDDIHDSGRTLRFVRDHLAPRRPRSLAFACLLSKQTARSEAVEVRDVLFTIPDVFVVGCGLDLRGYGRNLPDIWALRPGTSEELALQELLLKLGGGVEENAIEA